MYQYILVCTYAVPVHTHTNHSHTSFPRPFRRHHACDPHESPSFACPTICEQNPASSVNLIDVAALPSILCSSICTSCRETCTLVPAVLVRDSWCRIAIQKAGHQGDSAHHVPGESHIETWCWCWGWFIKLDHPSIFHWSFDGQGKLLKGADENQVVPEIVWALFVLPVLWLSSASKTSSTACNSLIPCSLSSRTTSAPGVAQASKRPATD